jgi:2-keto-4-pentenoate hydratase
VTPADWDQPSVRDGTTRMLELRARALQRGERHVGWKLAFGAPASLARFGLSGPVIGFLTDATVHPSGSTVSCSGWAGPVAEPELAAYFDRDVDDPGQASDSIGGIGPAIELANVDPPPADIGEVIAGNIYHRAVLFGDPDGYVSGCDVSGFRGVVEHNGETVEEIEDLEALTGRIESIVAHAGGLLQAAGETFRKDDILILGSVTPPLAIEPGEEIGFDFGAMKRVTVKV